MCSDLPCGHPSLSTTSASSNMPKKSGNEVAPVKEVGEAATNDRAATAHWNQASRSAAGHGKERIPPGTKTSRVHVTGYGAAQKKK